MVFSLLIRLENGFGSGAPKMIFRALSVRLLHMRTRVYTIVYTIYNMITDEKKSKIENERNIIKFVYIYTVHTHTQKLKMQDFGTS